MKMYKLLAIAVLLGAMGVVWNAIDTPAIGQDQSSAIDIKKAKISFAEALVKVAEADLAKAQTANAQAPEAVPSSVVRSLQNDVTMTKARVNMLNDGAKGESPLVLSAKDSLATAEESLNQAHEVNTKTPGTINNAELARRQALIELERARLSVAQQLEKASPEERVQWELMLLAEEVHNLRFSVQLLQYRN